MRILPVSDIHTEFHEDGGRSFVKALAKGQADVLAVAGDCGTLHLNGEGQPNLTAMLGMLCDSFPHIVYCAGNHEHYDARSIQEVTDTIAAFAAGHPNFHWLNRSAATIDGQRFLGCTLWFKDDPMAFGARKELNDFSCIPGFVPWVFQQNSKDVKFLKSAVKPGDVVLTHHLPSTRSVHPDFKGSILNSFYVCDMSQMILRSKPVLWIHGHSHHSQDYFLADTQIVANPFGYFFRDENPTFSEHKIVELPSR